MKLVVTHTVDHFFRHESGKLVSVLSRLLGLQQLETAQDIVQDTLLQALNTWSFHGLPDNPSAWLYRVARNKAIDYLRRTRSWERIHPDYAYLLQYDTLSTTLIDNFFEEDEISDSQLKMIFACCHPSIPVESQIALALRTLCGLSVKEIARAFLTGEDTITKRIFRAKEKIRSEQIDLQLPSGEMLRNRQDSVLKCLYLLFNEGYNSSHPDHFIREELCEEAIRLCYMISISKWFDKPATYALLALFCFQASRLQARSDDKGNIILLKYQDRSKWYKPLIQQGFNFLNLAMTEPFENTAYHLEAAIAYLHASVSTFETTDWKSIYFLYQKLEQIKPGPVVSLNLAIASAFVFDSVYALDLLLKIKGLDKYYIYHTSLAELYVISGLYDKARMHYSIAHQLTQSKQEKQLLYGKIQECNAQEGNAEKVQKNL